MYITYIYIQICIYIYICIYDGLGPEDARRGRIILREFRDVVFEDVVFDNNSSVAPY